MSLASILAAMGPNPCEIAAYSICGRTQSWCTCVGTFATPSPCERDAQDGRGEVGEGAIYLNHNEGNN